ncbi:MAG: alpha/beta hydrolase [Rhizomicrobium sp.]
MGGEFRTGIALICAVWLLCGCTFSDALRNDPVYAIRTSGADSHTLTIPFVTDRKNDGLGLGGFGNHWSSRIQCGTFTVTVPASSSPGDRAVSASEPSIAACDAGAPLGGFVAAVKRAGQASHCDNVLLYVHGYNNTFRSAVLRTAQLAVDAEWPCAAAAFSWSSEGKFDRYAADIERSGYAAPALMEVLKALSDGGIKTNIIAHSMGARLTLTALAALRIVCTEQAPVVNELILAAPDVNAEKYNDDFGTLLTHVSPCVHRATIYASSNDMVLMLSESLHGGIPRAGLEPDRDIRYALSGGRVDIVDASNAPGDPLGHGYFVSSKEMLDDIMRVLHGADVVSRATLSAPGEPTLQCANPDKACSGGDDRYVLSVAPGRRPDLIAQLERAILRGVLAIKTQSPGF